MVDGGSGSAYFLILVLFPGAAAAGPGGLEDVVLPVGLTTQKLRAAVFEGLGLHPVLFCWSTENGGGVEGGGHWHEYATKNRSHGGSVPGGLFQQPCCARGLLAPGP